MVPWDNSSLALLAHKLHLRNFSLTPHMYLLLNDYVCESVCVCVCVFSIAMCSYFIT